MRTLLASLPVFADRAARKRMLRGLQARVASRNDSRRPRSALRPWGRGPALGDRARVGRRGRGKRALFLPSLGSGEPLALGGLVPSDAPAVRVGQRETELFRLPLTADTVVVQRDPGGLSKEAQARALARAVAVSQGAKDPEGIEFALPIANTLGLFPGSRERGTTVLTCLFFGPEASLVDRVREANVYAARIDGPDEALVGVTGPAPARYQQFLEIDSHLELVEIATVALILLVVGLTFRALGAALVTLFAAGIAFIVSSGVIPWVGERLGVTVPEEVEPLVVALTLGIVTDYAVFYLSGYRRSLFEGWTVSRRRARRRSG
jgi:RND superfamily putative drug exporter